MTEVPRVEIDKCGASLLALLADDPDCSAKQEFDALVYPFLWRYLKANHAAIGIRVAARAGTDGSAAPPLLEDEVEEAAHAATVRALERVRNNAVRFDPNRGTASSWCLRSAEFAMVEVIKALVSGRRSSRLRFTDPVELTELADERGQAEEPLEAIAANETLAEVASHLSEREWQAVRLTILLRYSYAEAAEEVFGDPAMTRQIEGLLRRGKRKLAAAWEGLRTVSSGASATNADENADNGGDEDE